MTIWSWAALRGSPRKPTETGLVRIAAALCDNVQLSQSGCFRRVFTQSGHRGAFQVYYVVGRALVLHAGVHSDAAVCECRSPGIVVLMLNLCRCLLHFQTLIVTMLLRYSYHQIFVFMGECSFVAAKIFCNVAERYVQWSW